MRLFYLVEEHDRVRFAAYGLGQLASFIVTYVPRRRTDKSCDAEFLLILAHVNPGHHRLVVEKIVSQCLCQFGLTCTRCSEEDERCDRFLRILQAGT